MFKYPKTFQCDNGSELKNEVTKLLEKHKVEIRRATTKYKHTHTAFVEAFNKELAKLLFKPMDPQQLQDPEKVSTILVKNFNKIVNKMNNTLSSMIDMKPKDAIKLDTVPLARHIQKKPYCSRMDCIDTFINLVNNMETKKDRQQTLLGDRIVQDPGNCVLYYLQDGPDRAFVREELMHVSEDTQVPPDWVIERK